MRALVCCLVLLALAASASALTQFATKGSWSMSTTGCTNCFISSCSAFASSSGTTTTCSSRGLPTTTGSPTCCQSQTRWGGRSTKKSGLQDMSSQSDKSGLGFSGWAPNGANEASPLTAAGKQNVTDTSGTPFALGVVTHYNLPISAGTAATQGTFVLTLFGIAVDGTAVSGELSWSFPLTIDETPNDGSSSTWDGHGCPYTTKDGSGTLIPGYLNDTTGLPRGADGCKLSACECSDRIYFNSTTAASSTGSITVGASKYRIDIVGFSDYYTYSASATASSFVSQEDGTTVKFLFGRLSLQCNCPGNQTSSSNDVCNCACPATAAAQSQADCPNADYLFDSTSCSCTYQNNNCAQQRANLSPTLDSACENTTCTQNAAGVYVLSVVPRANNAACIDASRSDLCNYRCITASGRSSCQQQVVSCPAGTVPCRTPVCSAGNCSSTIVTSGTCTPSAGASACTNYACNSAGDCIGTLYSCPGTQVPDTTSGAGCACVCPNAATANCNSTSSFNTTTCSCQETACATALRTLTPTPDPACETVTCDSGTGQLTFTPKTDGAFCSTSPADKCTARCYTRTVSGNSRSTCNNTAVSCPAADVCTEQKCNAATGACAASPLASGVGCTPTSGTINSCFTYTCDGAASPQCVGADPCPDARDPDPAQNCACVCPVTAAARSQADCTALDYVFQASTCTCIPSGACTQQLAALSPALDSLCETVACDPATSTLTTTPAADGSPCGGASAGGLCNRRCRVNATSTSRGYCETQPKQCDDSEGCQALTCDDSTGTCTATQRAEGADCSPVGGPAGCTSYQCTADGQCVGTAICGVGDDSDDAKCRSYRCDTATNQCVFDAVAADNCSSNACSATSSCNAGTCRTFAIDCQSQEAVDAGLPGATLETDGCAALICRVNASTGTAACVVDYYLDQGTACPNANCRINSVCDGAGICKGDTDPDCDGGSSNRKAEIIGSAAAGGVLSVVGAGAVICAAAGAAGLVYGIRRRKLLNFDTWEAGAITGATVSPLYVGSGNEHVNPLAEL